MFHLQPQQQRTFSDEVIKPKYNGRVPAPAPTAQQQRKQLEVMDILACLDDSENYGTGSVATTVSCSASLSSDCGVSLDNLSSLETIPLSSTTIIDGPISYDHHEVEANDDITNANNELAREQPKAEVNITAPATTRSAGFSELMQAADDMLGSYAIMSPVLEDEYDEEKESSSNDEDDWQTIIVPGSEVIGQLIVPPTVENANYVSNAASRTTPLLPQQQRQNNRQESYIQSLLALARSHVRPVTLLSRDSFEISMTMDPNCTKQDVMRVLGNPDATLTKWFEPVQELIVTNKSGGGSSMYDNSHEISSSHSSSSGREYDGEWINAFTPSGTLVPPSSSGGSGIVGRYCHGTKQVVLDAFGLSSCGKVDMFVERRLGQLSFVVGPFPGGVFASHRVSVTIGEGGRVEVMDKVRLKQGEDDSVGIAANGGGLSGFITGGPLGRCFLPSVASYAEQTASSMARLWVLVNHGETS